LIICNISFYFRRIEELEGASKVAEKKAMLRLKIDLYNKIK